MRNGNQHHRLLLLQRKLVLTVPMRNGNFLCFLSHFHHFQVLTVPMRNGNQQAKREFLWHSNAFLPYLWGMETSTHLAIELSKLFRSYRTYEEWKLLRWYSMVKAVLSSYRTYEEWKPLLSNRQKLLNNSSYRTYEEWKLLSIVWSMGGAVLFLPYLWGMETQL